MQKELKATPEYILQGQLGCITPGGQLVTFASLIMPVNELKSDLNFGSHSCWMVKIRSIKQLNYLNAWNFTSLVQL